MAKPPNRAYSRYSLEAVVLLGRMVRAGRLERKITELEMATRMGVSRSLLQRIEKGDPGCGIGAVFEAAAIAGVSLFESDREQLESHRAVTEGMLRLLPKRVRRAKRAIKDDF